MIKKDNSGSSSKIQLINKIILFPKIHKNKFVPNSSISFPKPTEKNKPKVSFPKIYKSKPIELVSSQQIEKSETPIRFPKIYKTKNKPVVKEEIIRERKNDNIEYEGIVRLITQLIIDSKTNLISRPPKSSYFKSSKRFLMNKNGLLQYYLECINIADVSACLKQLEHYATIGYLSDIDNNNKMTIRRVSKE